ncbi:MAG: hypothetical protein K8I02_06100 [Candidatus Methylomirabilis sp.]|nr:hypothetical protein [Deltaproteobacteria bacterium]
MSLHDDLLEQAARLAELDPRRPKQASLRRAVSTAYYALFHLLVHEACGRLVSGPGRTRLRQCLGRAFQHEAMKEAAKGFASQSVSTKIVPALQGATVQSELVRVASAFVDLQQARHEADYDTARRFTRQETLDLVDQADRAFRDWDSVRTSLQADVFLVALLTLKHMRS